MVRLQTIADSLIGHEKAKGSEVIYIQETKKYV